MKYRVLKELPNCPVGTILGINDWGLINLPVISHTYSVETLLSTGFIEEIKDPKFKVISCLPGIEKGTIIECNQMGCYYFGFHYNFKLDDLLKYPEFFEEIKE